MPDAVQTSSEYADEGTALHHLAAQIITGEVKPNDIRAGMVITVQEDGKDISLTLTDELIRDCVEPVIDYYGEMKRASTGMEPLGYVEEQVAFPGIDGAFGTADLTMRWPDQNRTRLTDWKFGAGVPVKATYQETDPETGEVFEVVNEQLLFYVAGVRHEMPEMFSGKCDDMIELVIFQPRAPDQSAAITMTTVTHQEIDEFVEDVGAALEQSNEPDAPIRAGRWCEFAPCATNCPLKLKPLLDLTKMQSPRLPAQAAEPEAKAEYMGVLLAILGVADEIETLISDAKSQAHALLESGQSVPGWKLVNKRGQRQWQKDEAAVIRALKKLGVAKADLYTTTFASPAGAEKLLPKGQKLPDDLAKMVPGKGTTLAPDKDKRPAVTDISAIANQIAAAGAAAEPTPTA